MRKFKILYVDDEESNLRVFKDTFRRKYDVYTATSAQEGIKILEQNDIELILSDQRMPEMSGVDFLRYSFEKFPKANRILITGYSDFDAVENAINQAKVFQYVQKPWNEEALNNTIEDALRIYQLEKENARQKEELIIAKRIAEKSDQLKTEFLHNLSHEIRTPLNGISGFVGLLENTELSQQKKNEYIGIVQSCTEQLLSIIDEILVLSHLVTKNYTPVFEKVSVNKLISELHATFNILAKQNNLLFELKKGLPDEESITITDRQQLFSILCKILDNAFKYTISGKVELGYNLKNNKIVLYVSDTGVGIDNENKEIIFKRFSKEINDTNIKFGGLGIGLSIAQENAKLINADIWLESEKGKGTIFYVSVPYKQMKSLEKNKEEEIFLNNLLNTKKAYKVLIAEDERINFIYLEILLNSIFGNNIKILQALNGQAAINSCEKNADIDLILMDIKMPLLNGYEATKQIKSFMPDVPIIAQTAYSTQNDKEKAFDAGCDGFISKPIFKEDLESVLSKFLSKKADSIG